VLNSARFALPFVWIYFYAFSVTLITLSKKYFHRRALVGRFLTLLAGLSFLVSAALGWYILLAGDLGFIKANYLWSAVVLLGCVAGAGLFLALHPLLEGSGTEQKIARRLGAGRDAFAALSKDALFALIPIVGFTGIWVLVSDEMNYLGRFQYPVLIMVLLSWPLLLRDTLLRPVQQELPSWKPSARTFLYSIVLLSNIGVIAYPFYTFLSPPRSRDEGLYAMAAFLQRYESRHYTLAVTEAGVLPYYSLWDSIDTWGLNDAWIAHHGQISAAYLDRYKPEIIMYNSSRLSTDAVTLPGWESMVDVLECYATRNNYELAAIFPLPGTGHSHFYWVKRDFTDSQAILQKIKSFRYIWNGEVSPNLAGRPAAHAWQSRLCSYARSSP
jgi:hypothetical protein